MNIFETANIIGTFQCPEWGLEEWRYIKFANRDVDWALAQSESGKVVAVSENEEEIWDEEEIFAKFPEWR